MLVSLVRPETKAQRGVAECLEKGGCSNSIKPAVPHQLHLNSPNPKPPWDTCGPRLNHTFHKLFPLQERPFLWSSFTKPLFILDGAPSCVYPNSSAEGITHGSTLDAIYYLFMYLLPVFQGFLCVALVVWELTL